MSPTSSPSTIYDHLMISFPQQPKIFLRNGSETSNGSHESTPSSSTKPKSNDDHFLTTMHRKSIPPDELIPSKRRYTITQMTVTEPKVRCSVSNQIYDKIIPQKSVASTAVTDQTIKMSSSTESNLKPTQVLSTSSSLSSPSSSNIEVLPIDYRPLITYGRRRFTTQSSLSPMLIVKKKSPSPIPVVPSTQVITTDA